MSKKHRHNFQRQSMPAASTDLNAEYRIIRHDLLRVLIMNAIFLAGLLALYYTNLRTHYLEQVFSRYIHL